MTTITNASAGTGCARSMAGAPSRSCPHCGLTENAAYGGIPACRTAWGGSPEARPRYPNCLLAKQMIEWAKEIAS